MIKKLIFFIVICVIVYFTWNFVRVEKDNFYKDKINGFQLSYPSNWIKNKEEKFNYISFSPVKNINKSKVTIILQNIPEDTNKKDFIELNEQILKAGILNYRLVGEKSHYLSENEKIIEFEGAFGGLKRHWYQKYIFRNNKLFILTYASEPEGFYDDFDDVKNILSTFKILLNY